MSLTDLVPCEMAYADIKGKLWPREQGRELTSSLWRMSQTDVWISRDEIVDFF